MKNFEVYEDKIKEYDYDFAEKNGEVIKCYGTCKSCDFGINNSGNCKYNQIKWLYEEYKEPIKLSRLEFELLKYYIEHGYQYITRDSSEALFAYDTKPCKMQHHWMATENIKGIYFDDLFSFIKWEDEEPINIKELLENCEVIEDE